MYSDEWFETFAATVPAEFAQADLQGILSALPLSAYRRLLDVGALRWRFDGALVLWNSLGFVGRDADLGTLRGLASVLRPGGRVVLDLYHPDWLARHERSGERDERGASVRRWLRGGRLFHEIRYDGGRVDDIQFEVYRPDEMRALCASAGLRVESVLVAWCAATPTGDAPRYQLVACAPEDGR
jgi:hypothetical protein